MNISTLYYIYYVILAMYMLDSDQEPSYNFSNNLLLLPRILKLIEDMVDDSTPLLSHFTHSSERTLFRKPAVAANGLLVHYSHGYWMKKMGLITLYINFSNFSFPSCCSCQTRHDYQRSYELEK